MLGLPAAVLRNGRLLAANALFDSLVPGVAQDRASRLTLTDRSADHLLVQALETLGITDAEAVQSIPIRARDERPPLIVHVLPVRRSAQDVFAGAEAILIVTPVVPKEVPTANVVQGLFDLTPAEAKLAVLVAAGRSPGDAAVGLRITTETARTTLKRIFSKTGTHRQVELVALLSGVTLP
jgi:DNA-binding CsgD family transcriptional regulator